MLKGSFHYPPKIRLARPSGGFTLLELMLVMGLASLVYALISYMTIQMNNTVRHSQVAFKRRELVIETAERLRWQLRCLYDRVPEGAASQPPSSHTNPPSLLKSAIYGKSLGEKGQDVLLFKTTYFPLRVENSGTAEVGYKIVSDSSASFSLTEPVKSEDDKLRSLEAADFIGSGQVVDSKKYLAYRQYPWADPLGLHEVGDDNQAPWEKLSSEIIGLEVRFSDDLEIWQQDWTGEGVPKWIEVTFELKRGEPLVFMTGPVTAADRW